MSFHINDAAAWTTLTFTRSHPVAWPVKYSRDRHCNYSATIIILWDSCYQFLATFHLMQFLTHNHIEFIVNDSVFGFEGGWCACATIYPPGCSIQGFSRL